MMMLRIAIVFLFIVTISTASCDVFLPNWDYQRIVYSDSLNRVYSITLTGKDRKRITGKSYDSYEPSFAHGQSTIVYVTSEFSQNHYGELAYMKRNGSNRQPLSKMIGSSEPLFGNAPTWLWLDGEDIVAYHYCDCEAGGAREIYSIVISEGEIPRQLTRNSDSYYPEWSPNPLEKIAFISERDFLNERSNIGGELYVMDRSGENQQRITATNGSITSNPVWTEDGEQLIVIQNREQIVFYDLFGVGQKVIDPRALLNVENIGGPISSSGDGKFLYLRGYTKLTEGSRIKYHVKIVVLDIEGLTYKTIIDFVGTHNNFYFKY